MNCFKDARRQRRAFACLGLAAVIGSATPVLAQNSTLDVLLPNDRTTVFYGHFVAQHLGYYEEEGVDVNMLSSATTVPYVAFLSNGDADLVMLDAPQVYQAVDTDQPVAVIFEDMQFAPEAIFVSNESEIQKVEELKGTTVGLASDRDRITLQVALESVGLSMDDVQTAVVGDAGATLANAFRNQTVSAVAGGTSDMAAVEANGILIRDITPPAVSENPANSFVIWKPRMDELREPVQKFLKAWAKGMEAGAMDLDFTAAIMTKEIPEQWEKREVGMKLLQRTANQLHKPLTEKRGDLQPEIWERVQAPYIEIGEISKQLDPATFLDDSFIAGANEFTKEELQADIEAYKQANPDMFK